MMGSALCARPVRLIAMTSSSIDLSLLVDTSTVTMITFFGVFCGFIIGES